MPGRFLPLWSLRSIPPRSGGNARLSLIDQQIDSPIMLDSDLETAVLLEALLLECKDITASISYMNVLALLGCLSNLLCLPKPHRRFFLFAFIALVTCFTTWSRLPQKRFLCRYSQDVPVRWIDRQDRLQQVALRMISFTNRTQSPGSWMMGVVHLRHVLNQQDPFLLLHHRLRLLQMGSDELFIARLSTF